MNDTAPTVSDLYLDRIVAPSDIEELVEVVLAGQIDERAVLSDSYRLNVSAAIKANRIVSAVLADKNTPLPTRRSAARTAILQAQPERT
ncbi:hypothetical protein ASF36_24585 [Methylobacterium sp. Leaf90]|nr:hypothetical protein ASF36_24585 [Methylobacterium sp. Leaf90]